MKGIYGIWNDLCQSFDTGEDDAGWPSYEAALSACADGADMPAYHGPRGLVFGRTACAKAEAAVNAAMAQDAADRARRAATVASILAATPAPAPKASREDTLRKMLAANEASLTAELAKRKQDKGEIARLRTNCQKLRGDLGIMTPDQKLMAAIFG